MPVEGDPDDQLPPLELVHIWGVFTDLRNAAGSSGFGPAPITYQEIDAYSRLMQIEFEPWEVELFKELDVLCIRIWSKKEGQE